MTTTNVNLDHQQLANYFVTEYRQGGNTPAPVPLPEFSDSPDEEISIFINRCELIMQANGWTDDTLFAPVNWSRKLVATTFPSPTNNNPMGINPS